MMKKIYIIIIAVFIIGASSCEKLDELLTFYISDTTEVVVESSLFPIELPMEIPTPDITTNSEEEFSNEGTNASLVKDVYLSKLTLDIISPENKTFSFLKSMRIYIRTNDSDEKELAYKENISSNAKQIDLTMTGENLDRYIKADSYKLRTEVTTRETLTQDVKIQIYMRYKVTADPL